MIIPDGIGIWMRTLRRHYGRKKKNWRFIRPAWIPL
jgi:hypothetical protein